MSEAKIEYYNFYYFSPPFDKFFLPKRSLLKNLLFFFAKITRDFLYDLSQLRFFISFKDKVVFYCVSENDLYAVRNIYEHLDFEKLIVNNPPRKNIDGISFPRFIPSFITLLCLPAFLKYYLKLNKDKRQMVNYSRSDVMMTHGYYIYFRYLLSRHRPTALIFSNDHLFDIRILTDLSNQFGIATFYIQHASVTENFPKLDMTYALLEGHDARDKYIRKGSDPGKISLIGMIKYDQYTKAINTSNQIRIAGYAINGTEDEVKLIEDLRELSASLSDLKIVLRPHPWQYNFMLKARLEKILKAAIELPNVSISDPRQVRAFEYLTGIDVLICADSSIHLEAALINVLSIYYDNMGSFPDFYGYLKNGLSLRASNMREAADLIKLYRHHRPSVREKAKYYMETLNTPFEGKSTELAVRIIHEKLGSNSGNA